MCNLGELGAGSQLAPMADELTSALVAQSLDPDTAAVDAAHMAPALLALAVSQGSVLGSLAAARTLSTLPEDTLQVRTHQPAINTLYLLFTSASLSSLNCRSRIAVPSHIVVIYWYR